jgi:hypothetical protein
MIELDGWMRDVGYFSIPSSRRRTKHVYDSFSIPTSGHPASSLVEEVACSCLSRFILMSQPMHICELASQWPNSCMHSSSSIKASSANTTPVHAKCRQAYALSKATPSSRLISCCCSSHLSFILHFFPSLNPSHLFHETLCLTASCGTTPCAMKISTNPCNGSISFFGSKS